MKQRVRPIGKSRLPQRLVRWAMGLPLTAVRYAFQRVPLYSRDYLEAGATESLPDSNREMPGNGDDLQRPGDGYGPLFHRRYAVFVTDEERGPEDLIAAIVEDPNLMAPSRMARFETFDGELSRNLSLGDELVVRLPGPWDGPVRVVAREPGSFRLATLKGHMEAGEIEFSSAYDDRGFLRFQIESWARSGSRVFWYLYDIFPLGREMQLHMWSQFCRRTVAVSGGVQMSSVTCMTRRVE